MKLTASDRTALLKLAGSLPKGDENRRAILRGLKVAATPGVNRAMGEFPFTLRENQAVALIRLADRGDEKGLREYIATLRPKQQVSVIKALTKYTDLDVGPTPSGPAERLPSLEDFGRRASVVTDPWDFRDILEHRDWPGRGNFEWDYVENEGSRDVRFDWRGTRSLWFRGRSGELEGVAPRAVVKLLKGLGYDTQYLTAA
jgi:hypothetical protein